MSVNSHSRRPATARKQPVQARSQRTVDAVLDAAARIFAAQGYTGTTTNHVAELAGISIGSLYQYFPNKDALLVALEERHLDQNRVALHVAMAEWRAVEPDVEMWSRSFVTLLVRINDSQLHLLLYETAPALPHGQAMVEALIEQIATDLEIHLRRWGVRSRTSLRAHVIVVAALRLVHDLVIQVPPGRARNQAKQEVAMMVAAYVRATPSMPDRG